MSENAYGTIQSTSGGRNGMPSAQRGRESGFSLIELLVAMVVTMIITGAMYGLLAGGQNAFRREPELSDRQQAIRIGMARIQEDAAIAGERLPTFSQVFTPGLDGQGQMGPNGATDILEIIAGSVACPDIVVDPNSPLSGANINMVWQVPGCYPEPGPVMVIYPAPFGAKPGWGHNIHAQNMKINFPPGQQPGFSQIQGIADLDCPDPISTKTTGGCSVGSTPPVSLAMVLITRYQIAPDPADGLASLWRSNLGGFDDNNTVDPSAPTAAAAGWRLVARGVEDLQVQYRDGTGAWLDDPGGVTGLPNSVIQEVRVLLSARTSQGNLAGATSAAVAAAGDAVRGQLISTIVVRSALANLSAEGAENNWDPNDPLYWH